ncbi:MAG: 16S rRNA (uracil(1498)-N(3))-methyltransferase [Desulfobacterales bacterium]|jgi:16S rRNA (uracil1498-N3)-methyltransferase|nr:16S rRNA (uracil(1498)-N(3))-methyltransferase [Desulfobacterales bacterium]
MRRFFIDPTTAEGDTACLSETDSRHIRSVLRLKPGAPIILFDGAGKEYTARVTDIAQDRVSVSILDRRSCASESPVHITIAQAFLKEKKMDTLIRSLTELGINRVIPYFAHRSVPRPEGHRIDARAERWQKIIRESLKQCRRSHAPEMIAAASYEEVIRLSAPCALKIAFWEKAVDPVPTSIFSPDPERGKQIFILLGPEGGLTEKEIETATAAGFVTATLGPRILRAETAALVACSLMQYIFGDLGGQPWRPA